MSTNSLRPTDHNLLPSDEVITHSKLDSRLPSWWRMPTTLTVLASISLLVFGFRAVSGHSTTFTIAKESFFTELGLPKIISLPASTTAIFLSVLLLLIAALTWYLQAANKTWRKGLKPLTLISFGFIWAFTFLIWAVAGQSLDLGFLLQATLALAVPLVFGALAGVLSERAGVINIAIEGQLLFGAFGAALFGSLTSNPWIGLIAAPLVSLIMGALLALFAVGYHVQQIIVGVVLNVFALGITGFFFGTLMKQDPATYNQAMRLPNIRIPLLADLPIIGPALFDQNILVYLMWIIVLVLTIALFRTRWGLRVRSVGEHPLAADTVGINVAKTRWSNVLLGAAVAGLGGATLTIGTNVAFAENMSAGKGYIALAAMILGRYHPVGAMCAALFFAFATALQQNLGILGSSLPPGLEKTIVPSEFLAMLPYILTLLAVAGLVGRVRVPAADGEPYIKQ